MRDKINGYIDSAAFWLFVVAFGIAGFEWGYRDFGIIGGLIEMILVPLMVCIMMGLLIFLVWRIATPEGREAEREAQARHDLKKWEKRKGKYYVDWTTGEIHYL